MSLLVSGSALSNVKSSVTLNGQISITYPLISLHFVRSMAGLEIGLADGEKFTGLLVIKQS